jgi:peptidyl-prolyl cis-trans isomerase A (cyclophilin A)
VDRVRGRDYDKKTCCGGPSFRNRRVAAIAELISAIATLAAVRTRLEKVMAMTVCRRTILQCATCVALATMIGFGAIAPARATVVRFQTSSGNVDVRLNDALTPNSITNFTNYVTSNRYDGTFIHRVPQLGTGGTSNFVVQGGGFKLNNSIFAAAGIVTDAPIADEFNLSNTRGTLSFAKNALGATSQWFFNIGNNSFLDAQGFTVFGRVVNNGMTVVDAINNLTTVNAAGAQNAAGEDFDEIPVYNITKVVNQQDILNEDAVMILDVRTLNIPAGDYNFDGRVNAADLTVWKADFGSTTKAEADGNGNGRVDAGDFLIWQRTLGQNFGTPTMVSAVTSVPEPGAATLAACALAALARCRRRRYQ